MTLLTLFISLLPVHPLNAALTFNEAVSAANTPQKLAALMKSEFRFATDEKIFRQTDHWQSPEEIWSRKIGDCEDYALFAQYVLRTHGIEAQIVSIYGVSGYAHTIVIFEENGFYRVMNQAKLERFRAKSMNEAIGQLNPGWTWAAIADRKAMRGYNRETIFNPSPARQTSLLQRNFLL